MRTITIIAGPTAVGKTKYAIRAAQALDGEIVSSDSMQLYRYMDIGSAKPSAEELSKVRHHLVDVIDPRETFSVAKYQIMAKNAITDIFSRCKIPIVSGGTGLYINSLVYEMNFGGTADDPDLRLELWKKAENEGLQSVHDMLHELDPKAAERIHPNNVKKVIRAVESAIKGDKIGEFSNCTEICKDYDINFIILTRNRSELYDRINRRVDVLVSMGLFDEVRKLMAMGLTENDIAMKGIGYKEIISYLNGDITEEQSIELIKKNTRHFAKRQLTWFRRYPQAVWFNISDYKDDEEAIEVMLKWLRNRYGFTTKATDPTM